MVKNINPGPRIDLLRSALRYRPRFFFAAILLSLYALTAAAVWSYDCLVRSDGVPSPAEIRSMEQRLQPPSPQHWCGTDYLGRDVFWRTVFGVKTAFYVGLLAGGISIVVGVGLGAVSGYFGGFVDAGVVWLYSTFAAMPTLAAVGQVVENVVKVKEFHISQTGFAGIFQG